MAATYVSSKLENGVKLGIHSSLSLFRVIKPFTEGLFRSAFIYRHFINKDAILFKIEIKTEGELVRVGEFYYRSDGTPFEPEMGGLKTSRNLFHYLDQPFRILITTRFLNFTFQYPFYLEYNEESVPPKPLKKTFKFEQCVICLDRKPNVLLIKCNHICTCKDCEKTHPSTQCPYCRAEIYRRLLI